MDLVIQSELIIRLARHRLSINLLKDSIKNKLVKLIQIKNGTRLKLFKLEIEREIESILSHIQQNKK